MSVTRLNALIDVLTELGYDPSSVTRVVIEPRHVTVTELRRDENGRRYVDPETQDVAVQRHVHEVTW